MRFRLTGIHDGRWGTFVGRHSPEWRMGFHFVGWGELSLGINVGLEGPNLQIHVPFGFFHFGRHWVDHYEATE